MSALAAGIVFGAFLAHMLPDSLSGFKEYLSEKYADDPENPMIDYPFTSVLVGAIVILLIAVDRTVISHGIHGEEDHHSHDHISQAFLEMRAAEKEGQTGSGGDGQGHGHSHGHGHGHSHGHGRSKGDSNSSSSAALVTTDGTKVTMLAPGAKDASGDTGVSTVQEQRDDQPYRKVSDVNVAAPPSPTRTLAAALPPRVVQHQHSHQYEKHQHGLETKAGLEDLSPNASAPLVEHNTFAYASAVTGVGSAPGPSHDGAAAVDEEEHRQGDHHVRSHDIEQHAHGLVLKAPSAVTAAAAAQALVPTMGIHVGHVHAHVYSATGVGATRSDPNHAAVCETAPACVVEPGHQHAHFHNEAVLRAWVFFIALSLHAIFDGLSLGSSQDLEGFYSILAAVVSHKIFDGLALGVPVYLADMSRLQSNFALISCAAATPLGIAIGMGATESVSGQEGKLAEAIIIGLSAGSFLFISLVELLPAALHDGRLVRTKLFAFFLGWMFMIILAAFV